MLMVMLAFTAITAIPCGVVLMIHPDNAFGLSITLLENSVFKNYFIPGLVLTVLVGGVNFTAFFINYRKHDSSFLWTLAAGIMDIGWIVVQIWVIHSFSWFQLLYLLIGFATILIILQLKHKELI